jgi:hypothetical protein
MEAEGKFLFLLRLPGLLRGFGRLSTGVGIGRSTLRFLLSDPCLSRETGEEYEGDEANIAAEGPGGDGGEEGVQEQGEGDAGHAFAILSRNGETLKRELG